MQTQYFSRNRPSDWESGKASNLEWSEEGLRIQQTEKYGIDRLIRLHELEGITDVHEFAIGRHGRLYLLDDQGDLWSYDQENRHHELLFPFGHQLFGQYAMLTTIGESIIIADAQADTICAAYSLSNGQTYWTMNAVDSVPIRPLAITSDNRYIYIVTVLDVVTDGQGEEAVPDSGRLGLIRIAGTGETVQVFQHEKWKVRSSVKLRHLRRRFFIAAAQKSGISVFDSFEHILTSFTSDGELTNQIMLPSLHFAGLAIDSNQHIYIGDSRIIEEEGEDDRFIMNFGSSGELIAKVAGFRGKVDKLLLDGNDRMYILNAEEGTVTVLEMQPRTLERAMSGRLQGLYITQAFDSNEAETIWHRMTLDARIPEETQLRVSYFSSDRDSLIVNGVYTHLDSYIMNSELSLDEVSAGLAPYWSDPVINPRDALFFNAKGRYLWMKLEWLGSERKTPMLRKLRIYFPRTSYLSYLPALYQEDVKSKDFLERFLSMFGTLFDQLENRIGSIPTYLDSDLVSGAYLKWLGTWLGIEVDEHWTDEQLRNFIKSAPDLYRYRGTRTGIEKMVEIYTGEKPYIIEYFEYKQMREMAELRELTDALYGTHPCSFTVLVRPEQVPTDKHRQMLQRLLDEQKPAYTDARLILLEPWMYLNMHTYIGVNTTLTEPSLLKLDPKLSMPNSTLIVDVDRNKRLDIHTRLEMDSELE